MRPTRPIFASKNSAATPGSSDSYGPESENRCCAARPLPAKTGSLFGHLLDKAPSQQFNILYDSLVNAVRDEIPETVERIWAKAVQVFTDVERLCNIYLPQWLASDGMDATKIAAFYADPLKRACDEWSGAKAFDFRSVMIATSPYGTAQRWARFIAWSAQGLLRRLGGAFHREPNFLGHSSSSSSSSRSSSSSSRSSSSSSLSSA